MTLKNWKDNFYDFVRNKWPEDIPNDCTKLDENYIDCIDNYPKNKEKWCPSCSKYVELMEEFYDD